MFGRAITLLRVICLKNHFPNFLGCSDFAHRHNNINNSYSKLKEIITEDLKNPVFSFSSSKIISHLLVFTDNYEYDKGLRNDDGINTILRYCAQKSTANNTKPSGEDER